jgi:hypothetical protein
VVGGGGGEGGGGLDCTYCIYSRTVL